VEFAPYLNCPPCAVDEESEENKTIRYICGLSKQRHQLFNKLHLSFYIKQSLYILIPLMCDKMTEQENIY